MPLKHAPLPENLQIQHNSDKGVVLEVDKKPDVVW